MCPRPGHTGQLQRPVQKWAGGRGLKSTAPYDDQGVNLQKALPKEQKKPKKKRSWVRRAQRRKARNRLWKEFEALATRLGVHGKLSLKSSLDGEKTPVPILEKIQEPEFNHEGESAKGDHTCIAEDKGGPAGVDDTDRILLIVPITVRGHLLRALIDSGATRSFMNSDIVGALGFFVSKKPTTLELATGTKTSSDGVIPDVFISVGNMDSRLTLTSMKLFDEIDVILGKDWLEVVNPYINWRKNFLATRNEKGEWKEVHGLSIENDTAACVKQCMKESGREIYCLSINLHDAVKTLSSDFWRYTTNSLPWNNIRRIGKKNAEEKAREKNEDLNQERVTSLRHVKKTIHGRVVRQKTHWCDSRLVNAKTMAKIAKQNKEPVYLAFIRPSDMNGAKEERDYKLSRAKRKGKGKTQGELRKESMKTGPKRDTKTMEEIRQEMAKAADPIFQESLQQLFEEFQDVFPEKLPKGVPPDRGAAHRVDLVPGASPSNIPPYKLGPKELDELKTQLQEMLDQGWIRPSSSPYGSPVLFVPKKNGKWRMCIDYRALNKQTIKDRYPIPRVDELLDRLGKAKWFTKIDLASGYHQIKMRESDIEKTALRTRYGSFEFLVMPFGLCNAPATFQRVMNLMLHEGIDKFVLVFLDDILIYSQTEQEHLDHIRWVFQRLRREKIYGRLAKCEFCKKQVEYLGFDISCDGVKASPDKVKAVLEWPQPETIRDVRSFLGLASFYRRFIRGFSQIARPLTELTKKDGDLTWGAEQRKAFQQLKMALVTAPVLRLPDFDREFIVITDASQVSVGGILTQDFGNGPQPIGYESKKLNATECRYSAYERELLGIIWALGKWRHYLEGRHFTIKTDHASMRHLPTQASVNRRVWKWLQVLQTYDCDIVHIPGLQNPADPLSRRSVGEAEDMMAKVKVEEAEAINKLRIGGNSQLDVQDTLDQIFGKRIDTESDSMNDDIVSQICTLQQSNSFNFDSCSAVAVRRPQLCVTRHQLQLDDRLRSDIQIGQRSDPQWTDIFQRCQNQGTISHGVHYFRIESGLLRCKHMDNARSRGASEWKLVIPDVPNLKKALLQEMHSIPFAGHQGYQKTLARVQQHFWWPGHTLEVRDFVISCPVCQTEKYEARAPAGQLHPLRIPEQKWTEISMDFVTGLPPTRTNCKGVLVIVDRATKMVHLCALPSEVNAAKAAQLFWNTCGRLHGIPRAILSDRDPRFVSKFWQELWRIFGTKLRLSTAHHPQTDGQTEVTIRMVEQILRCMLHRQPSFRDWDELLPLVEFVINSYPNSSTGFSPFYLNFGYEPTSPLDLLLDHTSTKVELVTQFVQRMEYQYKKAEIHLKEAQDYMKKMADRRRRRFEFTENSFVYLSTRFLELRGPRKLTPRWIGPFKITRRISPVACELDLPPDWRMHNVFHVSLLKEQHTSDLHPSDVIDPINVDFIAPPSDGPPTIEKILRFRWIGQGRNRQREFLVLWAGDDPSDITWVREDDILDRVYLDRLIAHDQPVEAEASSSL